MFRTLAKIAGVSAVIAAACLALAFAIAGPELRGSGGFSFDDGLRHSAGESDRSSGGKLRAHSNFTGVDIGGGIKADVTVGPAFKVEILGDHPDRIETSVAGSQLVIRLRNRGLWWGMHSNPEVRIEMPALDTIKASAGAQVTAAGINADTATLSASAGAEIAAEGKCRMLVAKASSGAEINSGNLACDTGRIDASSGSDLKIRVSGKLDGEASSGADITNLGAVQNGGVLLNSGATLQNQ